MRSCALFDTWYIEWDFEVMCFSFWSHVFFILYVLEFWLIFEWIILHSVSYFFYSQSQSVCWAVESYCAKNERCFNESLILNIFDYFWLIFWSAFWLIHQHFDYFWLTCRLWWMMLIETESESQWIKSTDTQLCTVRTI